ncbi:MAG: indole-3-glycerol phosphate synthase TrpC [Desulfobacteraceae bacterium]|nr:MAG: indole-3-glycerol phosphate synthase TrpC [Desulfobacteraceae bacterium]
MNILDKIVERKKQEVAAARERIPEADLRRDAALPRERRSFFGSLENPGPYGINIIAEIKRASPSKGVIRSNLDPLAYAEAYEAGGASAISVLTDRSFFQGSLQDLETVRKAVRLPVLRKDFIISSYQIFESAVRGADAVLLIVSILSDNQLKDYLALSLEVGLDALVEVHTEADLERASRAGAKLIGINNRNLKSFETDIQRAAQMVKKLEIDQIAVAESGIRTREDIEELKKTGIFNFLIGESIVRSADPRAFITELRGSSKFKAES